MPYAFKVSVVTVHTSVVVEFKEAEVTTQDVLAGKTEDTVLFIDFF